VDCIREAENFLKYYRDLSKSIEYSDRMIKGLMKQTAPKNPTAVVMDITGIRASRAHDTLNQLYAIQKWQEMRELTLVEMEKVEDVLDYIADEPGCEQYKEVLLSWYVERMDKETIARQLGYSSKQSVYDIKNKAIRKFAVTAFGVTALKAV